MKPKIAQPVGKYLQSSIGGARVSPHFIVRFRRHFQKGGPSMSKKLLVVCCFAFFIAIAVSGDGVNARNAQELSPALKDNHCVNCHARLSNPYRLTSRYAEWHMSSHKEKTVGCEKCHGGNPALKEEKQAHMGMLPPQDAKSSLYPQNLPATCGTCHQGVVASFTESKHYQKLREAGLGPSCATCHVHMGSQVLYTPEETAEMCSTCHNSPNKLMPARPEIPQKANEVMQAIRRANTMVLWADRLIEQAVVKKMDVSDIEREQKVARTMLAEAKVGWHAFNLDSVQRKADQAFETSNKLKDSLRAKLFP